MQGVAHHASHAFSGHAVMSRLLTGNCSRGAGYGHLKFVSPSVARLATPPAQRCAYGHHIWLLWHPAALYQSARHHRRCKALPESSKPMHRRLSSAQRCLPRHSKIHHRLTHPAPFQDPGNLEGDLQVGGVAGNTLLWVLLWSVIMVRRVLRLRLYLGSNTRGLRLVSIAATRCYGSEHHSVQNFIGMTTHCVGLGRLACDQNHGCRALPRAAGLLHPDAVRQVRSGDGAAPG